MPDANRGKTYGQIAYEANNAFISASPHLKHNMPPMGMPAWDKVPNVVQECWDEIGRAVSVETFKHHVLPGGAVYTDAYEALVQALRDYLEIERNDVRKGPEAFAKVLKLAGLL